MRNNTITLVLIFLLVLFALYVVLPVTHPAWLERSRSTDPTVQRELLDLKLGLDLRGGTQVLLEADLPEGQAVPEGAIDAAKTIVENRVNGLGVAEAVVQAQGDNRIIVELPGVSNPDQAVETLRSTGQLEFVDPAGNQLRQGMVINTTNRPTAAQDLLASNALSNTATPANAPYPDQVFNTVMTGDILRNALATQEQFNQWQINFELTSDGSTTFGDYTTANVGKQLVIVLDGRVLSAPTIETAITTGSGVITGQFGREEAESLAVQMRYGSLPVPLKPIDTRNIGASLGQDSLERSLRAGVIGFIALCLFLLILYRLPGALAIAALVIYAILNLAIFKLIPVTLTLPGVAGFILSVGIAVDANILIFERMKEELRNGRPLRTAIEAGFSRAWPAIFDSNLSSLITCAVLFWFGSTFGASVVKGFAITLAIGVALSMFSSMVITRAFMRAFLAPGARSLMASRNLVGY
ncbi:MAG: protein translocase subunit SecD [Chloroflexota bacterium]|nr:protein translocase subunit SecD [Chloroflexota bacterium]